MSSDFFLTLFTYLICFLFFLLLCLCAFSHNRRVKQRSDNINSLHILWSLCCSCLFQSFVRSSLFLFFFHSNSNFFPIPHFFLLSLIMFRELIVNRLKRNVNWSHGKIMKSIKLFIFTYYDLLVVLYLLVRPTPSQKEGRDEFEIRVTDKCEHGTAVVLSFLSSFFFHSFSPVVEFIGSTKINIYNRHMTTTTTANNRLHANTAFILIMGPST